MQIVQHSRSIMDVTKTNFKEGQIWVSKNKIKYRIVSIETENPVCWYPVLLENIDTLILHTATADGKIYLDMRNMDDQLIMQVNANFGVTKEEKSIADKTLKMYNERKKRMEEDRKADNKKVKSMFNLNKPPRR